MLYIIARFLILLHYGRVSNAFAVLPASAPAHINMPTSNIVSSTASSWLASRHPKLNCGRMFLRHPAAGLITKTAHSGEDNASLFGKAAGSTNAFSAGGQRDLFVRMS